MAATKQIGLTANTRAKHLKRFGKKMYWHRARQATRLTVTTQLLTSILE
jgi:hypothetical protein